jgi:hypothetical protein
LTESSPLIEDALDVVKRVLDAHDAAPIADMERVIALAQDDAALRRELLAGTAEVLAANPASLVPCWLTLIVGELGEPVGDLLLSALGPGEGKALDATILSVLTRQAEPLYEAITGAIDDTDPTEDGYRAGLYGVLLAVRTVGSPSRQDDLRAFALRRQEYERSTGVHADLVGPEILLSDGGDAEGVDDRQLAEVRRTLAEDWRATARDIERRFGHPA